jgi:hypothetical protein
MAGYFTGGVRHKYSISIYQYIYNLDVLLHWSTDETAEIQTNYCLICFFHLYYQVFVRQIFT